MAVHSCKRDCRSLTQNAVRKHGLLVEPDLGSVDGCPEELRPLNAAKSERITPQKVRLARDQPRTEWFGMHFGKTLLFHGHSFL